MSKYKTCFHKFWCEESGAPISSDINTWSKFTWDYRQQEVGELKAALKVATQCNGGCEVACAEVSD